MNQSYRLDHVIKEIDKATASAQIKTNSSSKKAIIIDQRKREVLPKIPLFAGKNLAYYLVGNSNDSSNIAECKDFSVEIADFASDRKISLSIAYRVSCDPGNEEKVAKNLCSDNPPIIELEKRIERWVAELTRDQAAKFIDNYFDEIKKLRTSLQEKAKNEVGLRLELRISRDKTQASHLTPTTYDPLNLAQRSGLTINIEDIASNRTLGISLGYRASYNPEDQQKVAQTLSSDKPLSDEIDQRITKWIVEFTRTQVNPQQFIDNYFNEVKNLERFIKDKAKQTAYLKLALRISLAQEDRLKPIKIGESTPTEITVYVKDCDDPLNLKIQTELLVDDNHKVKAITSLGTGGIVSLIQFTKDAIKKYLLEQITVNQFYYELKDTVRNGLFNYLNLALQNKGRRIGYLYLDSETIASSPLPKELVEIQYSVSCKVQKYIGLITVENTLQMIPKDVRRYISAQSPNLEAWVKSKLEKIIKPLLLKEKYVDLLVDFEKESDQIRQAMQAEATSIGYAIEHLVSLPKLEHSALKEKLEIKDNKAEFSTNTSSIKVELTTSVNVKFENFSKIEEYLTKTDQKNRTVTRTVPEIIELIRETVNSTIREILRTVTPEQFYMNFYEPKLDQSGEVIGKSVEQKLKEAIQKDLEDQFGAKVLGVVPIPEQTEIIDHLQRLMGMPGEFECEVKGVQFQGDFKILGIEQGSWYIFQSAFQSMQQSQQQLRQEHKALQRQYSEVIELGEIDLNRDQLQEIEQRIRTIEDETCGIDDIKKSIEKSIRTKLSLLDRQVLQVPDERNRSAMEQGVYQWARESVVEQYGLEISIRNFMRSQTQQEIAQETLEQARIDKALEKSLKQLDESAKQGQQKLEAQTKKRQKLLEISLKVDEDKYEQLQQLYKQRLDLKLAGVLDEESEKELKSIEQQINILEQEITDPSLNDDIDDVIDLSLLEPKKSQANNFLEAVEQMSLPSTSTNQGSNSSNNLSDANEKQEDIWN